MKEDFFKELISEFHHNPLPKVKPRQLVVSLDTEKILSITGPRRAGKTAFCFHLIHQFLENGHKIENVLYINFEDERMDRQTEELDQIIQAYQFLYPELDLQACLIVFDEIQNVPKWDQFVRRIYDTKCKNIIITGSNSNALGKEIATSLRGRTLTYEMMPLSFKEYLGFLNVDLEVKTAQNRALIQHYFSQFLIAGGFPETVNKSSILRVKLLQDYFEVMMYRDVGDRLGIHDSTLLRFFIKRSFACVTKQYSTNRIFNELKSVGYKIGKNTVYDIMEKCCQAYVFFTLPKYTKKIANLELGDKKLYVIDSGLIHALGIVDQTETGKLMEQAVFLEAYRRSDGLFFERNGYECDFLFEKNDRITTAIQVTQHLQEPDLKKREIKGLISACKKHQLSAGFILTMNEKETLKVEGITISVLPLWEWLLT